ncbi:hypothetical protein AYO21_06309 [Fonsecaea monophora]|uniref:Uncharacterized protein n=1 Tax=Fonsecaea monophora TaxID=254056 RepID=A0A177F726_9EURO|nr:hypothetical protein AYO21_06309 [Fonsecaea monophora]OAG39481.1 hypothetical protein AYO21_06309 [Fonsecaea monophora]
MDHFILPSQPSAPLAYALDPEGYLNRLNDSQQYARYDTIPLRNPPGAENSVLVQATIRDQSTGYAELNHDPSFPPSLVFYHLPEPPSDPQTSEDSHPKALSIHQAALLLFTKPSSPEHHTPSRREGLARLMPFRRCSLDSLSMGSLYDVQQQTDVHIPRPLHYDPERSILLTSAWGNLRPLSLLFGEAFDQNTQSRVRTADRSAVRSLFACPRVVRPFFKLLGTRLAVLLATMHDPHIMKQLQLTSNAPSPTKFACADEGRHRLRGEVTKWRNHVQHMEVFVESPNVLDRFCRILLDDVDRQYFPDN